MKGDGLPERLAEAATSLAPVPTVEPASLAARARRAHRRRRRVRTGVVGVAALLVGAVGIGQLVRTDQPGIDVTAGGPGAGDWERLPDPPLSPRVGATAAWTGEEVVVVGGWEFLCPPGADCEGPDEPPFSDGAAYDPSTGAWRSIAAAPTGMQGETAAAVGGDLYLLVPSTDGGVVFLRYAPGPDAWTTLDPPPSGRDHQLAAAGRYVVAYAGTDELGEAPDLLFDTDSSTWRELPDDPFPPTFDRTIVSPDSGASLVLIAAAIEGSQNLVARFDIATGAWEELPGPPGRGFRGWAVDDLVVLEPHFGGSGGSFDPAAGVWSSLPAPPDAEGWQNQVAGVLGRTDAIYAASMGWVLDLVGSRWIPLSPPGERLTHPESNVTAVGRDLFVFGGERWEGSDGELLGDAWIWRAPGSDRGEAPPATSTSGAAEPGQLVVELVDPPMYIEGFDLAVRITPDGRATVERRLEDFVATDGGPPDPGGEPSSLRLDVASGRVSVQAHLTIGIGPGPREPDFVDGADGSICSPVEVVVPPGGVAVARMDWRTGCLESDDAPSPVASDLWPSGPPDASGVVVVPFPGDADERLLLVVSTGQPVSLDGARLELSGARVVRGADGQEVGAGELADGTRVDVWLSGCDESAPPACDVQVVRIRR